MGAKLLEIYQKAEDMGKIKAKMRLAMLTGVSSSKAEGEEDSPEILEKFESALKELEKEFK